MKDEKNSVRVIEEIKNCSISSDEQKENELNLWAITEDLDRLDCERVTQHMVSAIQIYGHDLALMGIVANLEMEINNLRTLMVSMGKNILMLSKEINNEQTH